jgi:hypothetical protein
MDGRTYPVNKENNFEDFSNLLLNAIHGIGHFFEGTLTLLTITLGPSALTILEGATPLLQEAWAELSDKKKTEIQLLLPEVSKKGQNIIEALNRILTLLDKFENTAQGPSTAPREEIESFLEELENILGKEKPKSSTDKR